MEESKLIKDVCGSMSKCNKRYEYWGTENGKPIKKWTNWFEWNSDYKPKFQLEKHPQLLNEYKDG